MGFEKVGGVLPLWRWLGEDVPEEIVSVNQFRRYAHSILSEIYTKHFHFPKGVLDTAGLSPAHTMDFLMSLRYAPSKDFNDVVLMGQVASTIKMVGCMSTAVPVLRRRILELVSELEYDLFIGLGEVGDVVLEDPHIMCALFTHNIGFFSMLVAMRPHIQFSSIISALLRVHPDGDALADYLVENMLRYDGVTMALLESPHRERVDLLHRMLVMDGEAVMEWVRNGGKLDTDVMCCFTERDVLCMRAMWDTGLRDLIETRGEMKEYLEGLRKKGCMFVRELDAEMS